MNGLFAEPVWLLGGLAALFLLCLLFILSERHAWRKLHTFAEQALIARLTASHSRKRLWVKNGLIALAVFFAFISLARPQWGANWEKAETRGIDIMIALDTSRSMLAEDISPNRLERSKLAILDLLETIRGDRVGLIAFAGNAFLQCPLTLDYQAFRQTLAAIDTETIPVGGTDLAAAIDEADTYFEQTQNDRILILITDGEDLEASGLDRALEAAEKGTKILTVGVGSTEGELIPVTGPGGQQDYLRDISGRPVSTSLDESTLRRIASATNGLYAPLGATGSGLERVYQFSVAQLPASERQESLQRVPIERYQWPLLLSLLLIIIESLMSTRSRKPAMGTLGNLMSAAIILSLAGSPVPIYGNPAEDAYRSHKDGRYEEAVTLYQDALQADPGDPKLLYNMGVSAYRSGQYEEAVSAFEQSLGEAGSSLQAKAFYNAGNSRVAYGFSTLEEDPQLTRDLWKAALTDYENALALNENHPSSEQNLQKLKETIQSYTFELTTSAEPPEGGTVSPGGESFYRLPVPIKAQAADGWEFAQWTGEGIENPEKAETIIKLEADTHVTAQFAKTWKLTVQSEDETMGSAGESGIYRAGEPVPIKAEAEDYFAFSGWESNTAEIADPEVPETEVTLDQDAVVTATFVPAFKLTTVLDPEIGGQAGPSGFFEEYSTVDIQAQPRPGFEWVGWIGDGIKEPGSQQTTITMTGDRLAIARMNRIWNLVIVPQPEEGGTVEGAGDHPVGSRVPISATPADGYTFQGWEGPGVADPQSPETEVTVQSTEHTLFARFVQDDQDQQQDQQQDNNQDQQQDPQDQSSQNQEQQQDEQQQDQEEEQDQEQPQDSPEQQENEQQEEAGQSGNQPEDQEAVPPGEMTREEARQLLNALSEDERFLPAGELSREKEGQVERPSGRNW